MSCSRPHMMILRDHARDPRDADLGSIARPITSPAIAGSIGMAVSLDSAP